MQIRDVQQAARTNGSLLGVRVCEVICKRAYVK